MTDSEYLTHADAVLSAVERCVDQSDVDIELERSGNVLTLEFTEGSKIIVNLQLPLHEIWIAAKEGGFHFKWDNGQWRDTRGGSEFFMVLSDYASRQAGELIQFNV